jgi:hypothetical protein
MPKDASYHRAAVFYNEQLAIRAEKLVEELEHEEVSRWARSVGKQHRFHEGRHQRALDKIENAGKKTVETEDGGEDRVVDDERIVHKSAVDGEFVTAAEAEANPDTTYETTVEVPQAPAPVEDAADISQTPSPVSNMPNVGTPGEEMEGEVS